jgi:hypothetical protein
VRGKAEIEDDPDDKEDRDKEPSTQVGTGNPGAFVGHETPRE